VLPWVTEWVLPWVTEWVLPWVTEWVLLWVTEWVLGLEHQKVMLMVCLKGSSWVRHSLLELLRGVMMGRMILMGQQRALHMQWK
jgi:hypothetical protein